MSIFGAPSADNLEVYSCAFELFVEDAEILIKFPCTYSLEIKSMDGKITLASGKKNVSAVNSIVSFHQTLRFQTDLLYSSSSQAFTAKEILLIMNLTSLRRPDQMKMVGRVTINLVDVIKGEMYSNLTNFKLDYCSVNVNIKLKASYLGKKLSHTPVENFDKDSFSDFQSFVAGSKFGRDADKTLEMGRRGRGETEDRAIEQSRNEDKLSRKSGRTSHKIVNSNSDQNLLQLVANQHRQQEEKDAEDNYSVDRVRSEVQYRVKAQSQLHHANGIEQIVKKAHAEEKRVWEQEKKFISEQLSKEKEENWKLREKLSTLERKSFENEFTITNIQAKLESAKKELLLVEKEKQLEIKESKNLLEKYLSQLSEKNDLILKKDWQIQGLEDKLKQGQISLRKFNDLEKVISSLNQSNKLLHQQIEEKQKQIQTIREKYEGQLEDLKRKNSEDKNYTSELQKQILSYHEQNFKTDQELNDLRQQINRLLKEVEQLKNYIRNLETELLKLNENQNEQQSEIKKLNTIIESLNVQINDMNIQIHRLNSEKTMNRQYVSELEKDILKKQEEIDQKQNEKIKISNRAQELRVYITSLESEILSLQEQVNGKQLNSNQNKEDFDKKQRRKSFSGVEELRQIIEQQKEYIKQLEVNIIQQHNKAEEYGHSDRLKALEEKLEDQKEYQKHLQIQILNMAEAERNLQVEEQKQYMHGLEEKILQDHLNEQAYLQKIQKLQNEVQTCLKEKEILEKTNIQLMKSVQQLGKKIQQYKQYQQGLEERILFDHQNIQNEQELKNSIDILKDAIKQQKEYQQGLEQRILNDHENLQKQAELKESLHILKETIDRQKQYQQGLEQRILEDHNSKEKEQNEVKTTIQVLQAQVQKQKEYQQGLQEKILSDYNLLSNIQLKATNSNDCPLHLEREKDKLTQTIKELQAKVKTYVGDMEVLEKKLNMKDIYIEELEQSLKTMRKQIYTLEEKINQQEKSNQDLRVPSSSQVNEMNEAEILGTVIRVISVHSQSSDEEQSEAKQESEVIFRATQEPKSLDSLLRRGSVAKSQISQPPTLKQGEQISDDLSYKGSPCRNKADNFDSSPNKGQLMTIKTQKDIQRSWERMGDFNNEQQDKQIKKIKQSLHSKEIELSKLNEELTLLKISNERLMKKSHEDSQFQSNYSKLESKLKDFEKEKELTWEENNSLQRRLNQLENELKTACNRSTDLGTNVQMLNKQVKQLRERNAELQANNLEYENRIKMLKEKEMKIEEALVIIEQESLNIAAQLEMKEKQKEDFKAEIQFLKQRIEELQNQGKTPSQGQEASFKDDMENLMVQNQRKEQEIHALKKKISLHSENSFRYESLLAEIEEKQHLQEQRQQYIKQLESMIQELKNSHQSDNVNDSVPEVRRLEERVEELEEQLFSMKATQNQKDIQIERLSKELLNAQQNEREIVAKANSEVQGLKKKFEFERNVNRTKIEQKQILIEKYRQQMKQNQNLIRSLDEQNRRYSDKVQGLQKLILQKQAKIKEMEKLNSKSQISKFEGQNKQSFFTNRQKSINQQMNDLKLQINELNLKIHEYENKLAQSQQECQQLEDKLRLAEESADRNRVQVAQLQRQIRQISFEKEQTSKRALSKSANLDQKNIQIEFQKQKQSLLNKIHQIQREYELVQNKQKANIQKIFELENQLRKQTSQKEKVLEELQEKQMEHLNVELDLQFKLRQKSEKSQIELAKSLENPNRKSFNGSQDISSNDLIPASRILKEVLISRNNQSMVEKQFEAMVLKINQMDEQMYSTVSVAKEKGLILEKTRLMSMEFSKLKVSIMKGKLPNEERMKLLTALRPIENTIKETLKLSEIHSQNLLSKQDSNNSNV